MEILFMRRIHIKTIASLFLVFLLDVSCNQNILDLEPSGPTEEIYFSNETEFNRGVLGIYSKLTDFYWYNGGQFNCLNPIFLLPGDDITCADNDEFEIFGPIQPSSGRVGGFFRAAYQLIGRSNIVLQKIDQEQNIYTTADLKNNHRGEALFLRGFGNFLLWNYFGTSPLITERTETTEQLNQPGTTGTQLLDQAIADFTEAATLLPTSWPADNRGRATKNSANGFLGKCLVFKGNATGDAANYSAAISAFNQIQGVSLVTNFDDNHAAETENNLESLFEFQASQPFGTDNVWLSNDFDNAVGSLSFFWGWYDNSFALFGKSRFFGTQKLLNAFEVGDPRRALTLDSATSYITKYVTRDRKTQSGVGSANNYRILRYADVLLLKAEALILSNGSTSEAIGLINQVRTRARDMAGSGIPADYSTAEANRDAIFNWIVNERLLELAGEGQRWLDLRRWQLAGKLSLDNNFFSSSSQVSFNAGRDLFLPIPLAETDQNPNVPQNPGYN